MQPPSPSESPVPLDVVDSVTLEDLARDLPDPATAPDGNRLPTYTELRNKEPGRFGRWRSWIEKRATDRVLDRDEDGVHDGVAAASPLARQTSIISADAENAAFARPHAAGGSKRNKQQPVLEPGPGAVPLTPATAIHRIGSRFLTQFTSKPLCAAPLPLAPSGRDRYTAGRNVERFLMVGTSDGLYVCDLIPALSQAQNLRRVNCEDTKIYQLWRGLGVHELCICADDNAEDSTTNGLSGLVIGLTSQFTNKGEELHSGERKISMWPLQALINLVKLRAFSENSECLDLSMVVNVPKRYSHLSGNAFSGFKSLLEKGKGREQKQLSVSAPLAQPSIQLSRPETLPGTQDRGSRTPTSTIQCSPDSPNHRISSPARSISSSPVLPDTSSLTRSFVTTPEFKPHLEIPLQWAMTSAILDFPKIQHHAPVLFIRLCKPPAPGLADVLSDREDGAPLPRALRRGSSRKKPQNYGVLYLLVATKQVLFVLESQPSVKRTWQICTEMSCPFTPTSASIVLSDFTHSPVRSHSLSTQNGLRTHQTERKTVALTHCAVAIAMKDHAALIRLSDLAVRELESPGYLGSKLSGGSVASRSSRRSSSLHAPEESSISRAHRQATGMNSAEALIRSIKPGSTDDVSFQVESRRNRYVGDRRWTLCEELQIPIQRLRGSRLASLYLLTRGHSTFVCLSPLGVDEPASGVRDGLPPPFVLRPLHTFTWRGLPEKIRARFVETPIQWSNFAPRNDATSSSTEVGNDRLFCCVTAFTSTGVETQEGFVTPRAIGNARRNRSNPNVPFFTPATQPEQHHEEEGEETTHISADVTNSSSYDYGEPIGWLCAGGPWFGGDSGWECHNESPNLNRFATTTSEDDDDDDEDDENNSTSVWREAESLSNRGDFFWKQSIGEYKIFWCGHS